MEIKVICECGTKYKFEVEPIDGHMPRAVKCPECGVDGTAKANAAIREALGASPAEPAATPAPAPRPSALRINVHQPAPAAAAPVHPYAATPAIPDTGFRWKEHGKKALAVVWKGLILLLCLAAMLVGFGGKKGKRVRFLAKITAAIFQSDEEYEGPWNLWGEDNVLLLVKHTNETEVADACVTFWQENHKKKVMFVATNDLAPEENQIGILPAHNGCVQILGGLEWPKEDFEKLTQYLSEKFSTVAVATRDAVFGRAFIFGVFDQGEKKFRAESEVKGQTLKDMEQVVTAEGEQWAREHGFKPGKQGFNEFYLEDADRITHRLGFKLWDVEEWDRCLLLTEVTNKPPARPVIPARAAKSR
jgi:hypothetical protein